MLKIGKRYHKA